MTFDLKFTPGRCGHPWRELSSAALAAMIALPCIAWGEPFTPPAFDAMADQPHAMLFLRENGDYFQFNRTPTGYTYNDAERLKRIDDSLGNRVEYGYDALGWRTSDRTYDPAGPLAMTEQLNLGFSGRREVARASRTA